MENNYNNTNSNMRLHRNSKSCKGCQWEYNCCDSGSTCEDYYNPSEDDDEGGGSDYINTYIEAKRIEHRRDFLNEIAEYGEQWN